MTARTNPFTELERVIDRINRQFEDVWGDDPLESWTRSDDFAIDVLEEHDEIIVTVDVPGFDRDEIDVQVADRALWIEAKHDDETGADEDMYLRRERRHRSHRRSIRLPTDVDAENIKARLRNGVLTVSIPKAEPTEEIRRIEIESE